MLGQGDNQIILIRIPSVEKFASLRMSVGGYITALVKGLHDESEKVGLSIKREETWASTVLFEYGKTYYFEGV